MTIAQTAPVAECARCGKYNRLIHHGRLLLQPRHACLDAAKGDGYQPAKATAWIVLHLGLRAEKARGGGGVAKATIVDV